MGYEKYKKYEYKSPSYELTNHGERCTAEDSSHVKNRRYYYDPAQSSYVSKQGKSDAVSMLFCGDLLCQEKMIRRFQRSDGSYDFSLCFEFVKPLFESADFVVGNLETPISHTAPYRGEIISHEGPYFCNAPVEYLEAVSGAGFDMLTTANNHTLDAGVRGLVETIENMDRFGFIHTGTFTGPEEKYVIVDVRGFRVGFTAFGVKYNSMIGNLTKEGADVLLNSYSRERAEKIFREMKKKGAEYIVCFPHWGKEYTEVLSPKQKQMAAELTEIGYDLVVGAHSHVIQMFRFVNEKPVLFSLGNLMSHLNSGAAQENEFTVMMNLNLSRDGAGKIVPEFKFVPCKILRNYMSIPYTVLPINEDLKLTRDHISRLKLALKTIRARLGCKAERVDAKFHVAPQARKRFEDAKDTFADRTDALIKRVSDSARAEKKETRELPKKGLLDKFQRYHRTADGLYKIYRDHADLVEIERETELVTLPGKVEDLPVRTIFGRSSGNNTTRLVYLGVPVVAVEKNAFRNFTAMESIRLFNNLEVIGDNAFENCVSMTGIILPGSLKRLGDNVFLNCGKLLSVKIPPSVTAIGRDAFKGCPKLTVYCEEGSYADQYAKEHTLAVSYMPLSESTAANKKTTEDTAAAFRSEECAAETSWSEECAVPVRNVGSDGVVMGPMNGPEDKHPRPIIAACYYLGKPLPASAKCGKQPSYYLGENAIKGNLSTIKKLLGDRMPEMGNEELEKKFRIFRKYYREQVKLAYTETDLAVYFTDWLIHANPRGFRGSDYFVYEFVNKEADIRETFMGNDTNGFRQRVYEACSKDPKRHCFRLKSKFNQTFAKYVNRDWVDATVCTFEEFSAFLAKHEKFFVKPVGGSGGVGARVIDRNSDTPENLFELCKMEELIVEELVKQHKDLAEFNASTLNTVRVNTLLCADGVPRITLTFARFGRSGSDADNFHAGGVGGIVDIDTGVMITDAINQDQLGVTHHPDSHKKFLGFQYPHWQDIKAAVCDAALMMPWVRHIGWDVAVTEKGTVEFIEGNCRPNFDGLQAPDQLGRLFRYKKYIEEIEAMNGKHYTEMEPLVIDITGMELDQ